MRQEAASSMKLPVGTADKVAEALLMSPSWTASRESQTHHLTSHGGLTIRTDADRVEPDAARAACPVRRRLIGLNPELGRSACVCSARAAPHRVIPMFYPMQICPLAGVTHPRGTGGDKDRPRKRPC